MVDIGFKDWWHNKLSDLYFTNDRLRVLDILNLRVDEGVTFDGVSIFFLITVYEGPYRYFRVPYRIYMPERFKRTNIKSQAKTRYVIDRICELYLEDWFKDDIK